MKQDNKEEVATGWPWVRRSSGAVITNIRFDVKLAVTAFGFLYWRLQSGLLASRDRAVFFLSSEVLSIFRGIVHFYIKGHLFLVNFLE